MTNTKIGRNDPCPCGSGKKFKRCCGQSPTARPPFIHSKFRVELAIHDDPLEHWTFGPVRVLRGFKTDDFFRDASITEESIIRTLEELRAEMAHARWIPDNAQNIYFDYDDDLAEKWFAERPSFDSFKNRLRPAGEAWSMGITQAISRREIAGVPVTNVLILYPKAVKSEVGRGNRMEVFHVLCHEFAHAFGVLWRGSSFAQLGWRPSHEKYRRRLQ